jgi:hypothetical protein
MTAPLPIETAAAALTVALVPLSGMFPRTARALTRGRGRTLALAAACASSLLGLLCIANRLAGSEIALALAAPLPQLAFLGLALQLFARRYGREPDDVLLDASPGVTPDGLFVLAVGVGSVAPFLFLIAPR